MGPLPRFAFLGAPGVGKGSFAAIIAPQLVRYKLILSRTCEIWWTSNFELLQRKERVCEVHYDNEVYFFRFFFNLQQGMM